MTNGDFRIIVKGALDKVVSLGQIQADLNELSKSLSLKVKIELDTAGIASIQKSLDGINTKGLAENLKADTVKIDSSLNEINNKIKEAQRIRASITKDFRDREKAEDDKFWKELSNNPIKRPQKGQDMYAEFKQGVNRGVNAHYFANSGETLDEKAQSLGMSSADELLQKIQAGRKKISADAYDKTPEIKSIDAEIKSLEALRIQTEKDIVASKGATKAKEQKAAAVQKLTTDMDKLVSVTKLYDEKEQSRQIGETRKYRNLSSGIETTENYKFDENDKKYLDTTKITNAKEKINEAKAAFETFMSTSTERLSRLNSVGIPTEKIHALVDEFNNLNPASSKTDFASFNNRLKSEEDLYQKKINLAHTQAEEEGKLRASQIKDYDRAWASAYVEKAKRESHLGQTQIQDQQVARNMAETQNARFDAARATTAKQVEENWLKNLKVRELREAAIAERENATQQKAASNYNEFWQKALIAREAKEKSIAQNQLEAIRKGQSNANNSMSGVTDVKALDLLNRKYGEVAARIQANISSNKVLTTEEVDGINRRIQRLGDLTNRQQQYQTETAKLTAIQNASEKEALNISRRYGTSDKNVDNTQINSLLGQLKSLTVSSANYKTEAVRLSSEISNIGASAKSTTGSVINFSDALRSAIVRLPTFMLAGLVIREFFGFFKDGISYVNELNKSLTELSIVYMVGQNEVAKYGEQFQKMGMEMGILTQEIAKGAVEFARQGLAPEDMTKRMATAVQYAKISNIDFVTSAKILTATVNSMGVDINRAADIFSYMGDATATGADEIGKAMQKVGGTAGSVNVEFEKVASWIAVISSRTREGAETIGQSVKSILARMQSLKETGFDQTDGTQVNQVAKALAAVDIKLLDTNNNFRNFGTVMDELGAKWGSLTNRQQAYLATTVAGTYQQSKFLNLMEGYKDSVNLYEKSLDQAGIAQKKFDLAQEGTEAKLNKLKNAWTGVFSATFKSEGIQSIIGSLTSLALSIETIIKTFGIFPTTVGLTVAALLLFNTVSRKFVIATGTEMLTSLGVSTVGFNTAALSVNRFAYAVGLGATGARVLTLSLVGLTRAFLPLALVSAVVYGLNAIFDGIRKHNEAIKEATTLNYEHANSLKEQKKSLEDATKEYKSLKEADIAGNATIDQKKRLLDIQQELVDKYGVSVTGINAEGKAYSDSIQFIEARTKALQDEIDKENESNKRKLISKDTENTADIAKYTKKVEQAQKKLADYEKQLADFEKKVKSGTITSRDLALPDGLYNLEGDHEKRDSLIQEFRQSLNKQIVLLQSDADKANIQLQDLMKDRIVVLDAEATQYMKSLQDSGTKISSQQRLFIQTLVGSLARDGKHLDVQIEEIKTAVKSLAESDFNKILDDFNTAKTDGDKGKMTDLKKQALSLLDTITKNAPQFDLFKSKIMDMFQPFDGSAAKVDSFAQSMDMLNAQYETSAKSLSVLNGMLEDNAAGKSLSAEAVQKLIKEDASLIDMFYVENGVIKLNTQAVEIRKNAELKGFSDMATARRNELITQNKILVEKLSMYEIEINAIKNVADALAKVDSHTNDFVNNAVKNGDYSAIGNLEKQGTDIKGFIKNLDDLKKQATISSAALNTVGYSTAAPKKEPLAKDNTQSDTKRNMSEFERLIKAQDVLIVKSQDNMATLTDTSAKYRAELQSQIPVLKEKQRLSQLEINSLEKANIEIDKKLKNSKLTDSQKNTLLNDKDSNTNKISDLTHNIAEYGKSTSEANAKITDSIDKQSKARYENSKKWIEAEAKDNELAGKSKLEILQAQLISQERSANHKETDLKLRPDEQKKADADIVQTKIDLDNEYYSHYEKLIKDKKDIDKLSIEDEINEYKKLGAYYSVGSEGRIKADKAVHDAQKALLDKTEKDYKDSIKKIQDIEDQRHKKVIDNLDAEKTKFDTSIDEEIKAEDRKNVGIDFSNTQADKLKQQADLNNQLALLNLRSDLEAKAEKIKIQEELDKLNKDIAKDTRDRDSQVVKDGLNDRKDKYDKDIDASKKAEDTKHEAIKASLQAILDDEKTWADLSKAVFDGNTTAMATSFETLGNSIKNVLTSVGTTLDEKLTTPLTDAINLAKSSLGLGQTNLGNNSGSSSTPSLPTTSPIVPDYKPPTSNPTPTPTPAPAPVATWQENLARAASDTEFALAEIARAKQVYEEQKALGNMERANAAHKWADQIREVNKNVPRYKDGGSVTHTGFAYVDGTPDRPEYMLSADNFKNLLPAINLASGIVERVKNIRNDIGNIISKKDNNQDGRPNIYIEKMLHVDKIDENTNLENLTERLINKVERVTGIKIRTSMS